jgi:hypothetical protein
MENIMKRPVHIQRVELSYNIMKRIEYLFRYKQEIL